ncbi:MAG: hypothetical protein HFG93_12585, partial [Dorea sp.]|nr:hypothetical protein [Dorea sp.]
ASPAAWVLASGLLLVMYFRIMHQYKMKGMLDDEEASVILKKRYT